MGRKNHTEAVDTAMHIVKGAIVQVLATPVTKSTQYNNKTNGRISVVYESDVAPTDAQVQDIVAKANAMVQKNVAVGRLRLSPCTAEPLLTNVRR
jgi:alanyl-tRNA synthetase